MFFDTSCVEEKLSPAMENYMKGYYRYINDILIGAKRNKDVSNPVVFVNREMQDFVTENNRSGALVPYKGSYVSTRWFLFGLIIRCIDNIGKFKVASYDDSNQRYIEKAFIPDRVLNIIFGNRLVKDLDVVIAVTNMTQVV